MSSNSNQQPTAGPSTSSSTTSRTTQQPASGVYSFSVHQPYTNWPLHHASATAAAYPSWYALSAQSYAPPHLPAHPPPRAFRENGVQTEEEGAEGTGGGEGGQKRRRYWDAAMAAFLRRAGLYRALDGFKEDVLLLNEEWERGRVQEALGWLVRDLTDTKADTDKDGLIQRELDERKLDYVQSVGGAEAQTPAKNIKAISSFLRRSRKRNDASNRAEWLQSIAEKRRRLNELGETNQASNVEPRDAPTRVMQDGEEMKEPTTVQEASGGDATVHVENEVKAMSSLGDTASFEIASCARTDAKPLDRSTQMKYDIAKNEDGPLRRTMKGAAPQHANELVDIGKGKQKATNIELGIYGIHPEKHPGLSDRLDNIEKHLAVRYVPSAPYSLLDRIKFLEDHIIKLEKENPPWAALHFNQPNRGWPPPPRLTPIIVPPHLSGSQIVTTKTAEPAVPSSINQQTMSQSSGQKTAWSAKPKAGQSSLYRAVMEKLEIQRAMGDLAGGASS